MASEQTPRRRRKVVPAPVPAANGRRRRKKVSGGVVVYMDATSPADSDPVRCRLRMEALQAAFSAHPGPMPVRLVFRLPRAEVETEILQGVKVAVTPTAIVAIKRAAHPGNLVILSDNPG